MENKKTNTDKTKKAGKKEGETGGKAARVRRMRKSNSKTDELRESNSEKLYNARRAR